MAAPSGPLFRTSLAAFSETWSGGPNLRYPVVRFGLQSGWAVRDQTRPDERVYGRLGIALLVPEIPFSVLPFGMREAGNIDCDLSLPDAWQSIPLPLWRGIPCRVGTTWLRLVNEIPPREPVEFRLLALLPERDLPGPRTEYVLLGMQFLVHYGFRVTLDYPAIQRRPDPETGQLVIDPLSSCGRLEIF
jgi:hypothetical protein